jgi:hypothetical protein
LKHIFNFAIMLFVLLSICCNDKQSSRKSGDNSEAQIALSNKQYSDDFGEAKLQLVAGVSQFSHLGFQYRENWEAIFVERVPAADIEAGEEVMRKGEGGRLSRELLQAIALAHAENSHGSIERYLAEIKNPPMAYAQAYAKLIETYGAYEGLYNIVIHPHGSKDAYKATAEAEERKFDSLYAQVEALTPEPQK